MNLDWTSMSTYWTIIIGYFVGTITWGLIIAKFKGVNLREIGSGNIGGTNVSRALGGKWGIFVILLDALKPAIAATIVYFLFDKNTTLVALTALLTIVGHCWPIWLKFKGGKGAATTLGFGFVVLNPWVLLIGLAVIIIIFKITKTVSIISILGGALLIGATLLPWAWTKDTIFGTMADNAWIYTTLGYVILLWRHRSNIIRLIKRTENKL
jgi:glycerol-3-phosphate acyltransferase PlsY